MASPSPSPPHHKKRRSTSSISPSTVTMNRQSSRELSVASIESARKAKAERDRVAQIQAQIDTLTAEQQAAKDNSERYNEKAEVEKQAAIETSFYENGLAKQKEFRDNLADEVYTRVATMLTAEQDVAYALAVSENTEGFDGSDFKIWLLDAITGNDRDFLAAAARKVYDRCGTKITDADVAEIDSSTACLGRNLVSQKDQPQSQPPQPRLPRRPSVEEAAYIAAPEHVKEGTSTLADTIERDQTPVIEVLAGTESQRIPSVLHDNHRNTVDVKQEVTAPASLANPVRRSIHDIKDPDNEGNVISGGAQTGDVAASLSTDVRQNEEEARLELESGRGRSPTPNMYGKRVRDDESVASSQFTQAKAPKKARVSTDGNRTAATRINNFVKYIAKMSGRNTLTEADFRCVACGEAITKEGRVAACLHLYDQKCLSQINKSQKGSGGGKGGPKVTCTYTGCGKPLGKPNKIEVEEIENLKKEHLAQIDDETDQEADKGKGEQEDETEVDEDEQ